ncbi:hypothetical protein ND860_18175 [Leptospira levettii]|uniref:hypothetical protein n=1 Tax=Leptospira levettii TaxID=2023178 RepID=UPI00223DAA5E|nr:hypothetical protein [Leptospira levettii]MCW7498469.1 hypothetical protein [Leptospira levettii]
MNINDEDSSFPEEVLFDYIEDKLSSEEREKVESAIKNSKITFLKYIALKETMYAEKIGDRPTEAFKNSILKSVLPKEPKVNHIQFIIRNLIDKVMITSSDQSEVDFFNFTTDFAHRGSKPGIISISREIDGYDITLNLSPGETRDEFHLNVLLMPSSKIDCELWVNGERGEVVKDLSKNSFFNTTLKTIDSSELRFVQKGKTLFTFGIYLKSE